MTERVLFADIGNTIVKWRLWDSDGWADSCWAELCEAPDKVRDSLLAWRPSALAVVASVSAGAVSEVHSVRSCVAGRDAAMQGMVSVLAVAAEFVELAEEARVPLFLAGRDFPIPIPTEYRDPTEMGLDRLCSAFAARQLFGAPVVTASAGTCLTVEAVDVRGVVVGGAIAAGVSAMAKGLGEAVPHLRPFLEDAMRSDVAALELGRSTAENLALGLWMGAAAALDRLVAMARAAVGQEAPVVLTGGDAAAFARLCRSEVKVCERLVLEGLRLAYENRFGRGPRE